MIRLTCRLVLCRRRYQLGHGRSPSSRAVESVSLPVSNGKSKQKLSGLTSLAGFAISANGTGLPAIFGEMLESTIE
jgi:hypothetical protein